MGQMCAGGREPLRAGSNGKVSFKGSNGEYMHLDNNENNIIKSCDSEQLSFSEYYTILAVDVTNLQSTGKFPTQEDLLESFDEKDYQRRDAIIELMVVSNSKDLWTTFNEYIKNNKKINLCINWPGIAHLAIFLKELSRFEHIYNSCEKWNISTVHELLESCVNSGGMGGLEIAKFILSKYNNHTNNDNTNSNAGKNKNQININWKNASGHTYLYTACMHSLDKDFIKFLLHNGADPLIKNNKNKNCIDIAKSILNVRNTFSSENEKYVEILQDQKNFKLTGCGYNGYEEAADQIGISKEIVKLLEEELTRLEEAEKETGLSITSTALTSSEKTVVENHVNSGKDDDDLVVEQQGEK
jgi:hypothetical protein